MSFIEILGYIASVIVFISLTMKSLVKLRIINAAGSVLFVIFALSTSSFPTAVLNIGIVIIDVYYFLKMIRVQDNFEIMYVEKDNPLVSRFYNKNHKEIEKLFGAKAFSQSKKAAFFFRNDDIAGLLAYSPAEFDGEKTAEIFIDFVVPEYRDLAVGRHFFVKDLSFWKNQGYECLITRVPDKVHVPYIRRLGFVHEHNSGIWTKRI
ncbi:hypothetical protein V1L52_08770 [Treponema sp. HNW]|uniref:hypothetical protein n=1 Tax=Treponema sp. HNW TaxID=3116654 RepID=UPI003D136C0F